MSQCEQEELKIIDTKVELVKKIQSQYSKLLSSGYQSLQTVHEASLEYHPLHSLIFKAQKENIATMIKLKVATPDDL